MKRIIWTDDIDIKNWIDDDGNQMDFDEAEKLNYEYLDDKRCNLNIKTGEIVCIANLGLWDGIHSGYQLIGDNLNNILYSRMNGISCNEWYSDGKNILHREAHYDGTNTYIYREVKGNTREEQLNNVEKLFSKP